MTVDRYSHADGEELGMESARSKERWSELYEEALLEHDPQMLWIRISEAQKAIQERTIQLWCERSLDATERDRLHSASRYLDILRTCSRKAS